MHSSLMVAFLGNESSQPSQPAGQSQVPYNPFNIAYYQASLLNSP